MYAQLFARPRRQDDIGGGLLGSPEPAAPKKGPLGFRESGFSFIPIRQSHLDFLASTYGCEAPSLDEVVGRALVDEFYLPRGVAVVHLRPSGGNLLYASFGKWLKVFPKDVLRGMSEMSNWLREREIFILDAF